MDSRSENISSNLQRSYKLEQMDCGEEESFECFADNLSFRCIWQQPDLDMNIINQFMEEINIYDSNEHGDYTPDVLALLSSSFPSETFSEVLPMDIEEKPNDITFVSSTPISKTSPETSSFYFLGDASPILCPQLTDFNVRLLPRRRLQMTFETEDVNENSPKSIKI